MIEQNKMRVKINGDHTVEVNLSEALDLQKKVDGTYSLIYEAANHQIEVHHLDVAKKEIILSLNGQKHHCEIETALDILIKDLGLLSAKSAKLKDIKAPMPGKVIEIVVKKGDMVKEGESLIILEAMKMENIIKAPHDLEIKEIKISLNEAVEKGAVLLKL